MSSYGTIPESWWIGALQNAQTSDVHGWFSQVWNTDVSINSDLSVWISGAGSGRWLTQEQIDETTAQIDLGV